MEDQKAEAAASESKGFENGLPRHGFRQSKPGRGRPNGREGATWEAAAGAEPVGDPVGEAEENAAEVVEALVAASPASSFCEALK